MRRDRGGSCHSASRIRQYRLASLPCIEQDAPASPEPKMGLRPKPPGRSHREPDTAPRTETDTGPDLPSPRCACAAAPRQQASSLTQHRDPSQAAPVPPVRPQIYRRCEFVNGSRHRSRTPASPGTAPAPAPAASPGPTTNRGCLRASALVVPRQGWMRTIRWLPESATRYPLGVSAMPLGFAMCAVAPVPRSLPARPSPASVVTRCRPKRSMRRTL
jgi:hypothetical protein